MCRNWTCGKPSKGGVPKDGLDGKSMGEVGGAGEQSSAQRRKASESSWDPLLEILPRLTARIESPISGLDIRLELMPRVGLLVPIPLKTGILRSLGSPAMGGDGQGVGSLITAE